MSDYGLSFEDIKAAHKRIGSLIHETPVLQSSSISQEVNASIYFKCENFQKTGSFKARGACNAIHLCDSTVVTTHSSGNHGAAVAWAAKLLGKEAHIVMPNNTSTAKKEAVARYGGKIVFCESTQAAREAAAENICTTQKATLIHPSNAPATIAGQGTIGLEFLAQVPQLQCIIVPVGGGGLISGIAMAAKHINPNILILGAEPGIVRCIIVYPLMNVANAADAYESYKSHELIQPTETPNTIADGLRTTLGSVTWPIVRDFVDDILTVTEDEIRSTFRVIYDRLKCVIEPSAAVAASVIFQSAFREKYGHLQHVGVIVCGGNVSFDSIAEIMNSTRA